MIVPLGVLSGSIKALGSIQGIISGSIVAPAILRGSIVLPEVVPIEFFNGPYSIVPDITEQVFETQGKAMSNDLEVLGIPFFEIGNTQGGSTIIIGGII